MLVTIDRGSGDPALVFLHNFGGSSREWTEVVNELSVAYRCLAADTNGFGKAAERTGFTVKDMVEDLTALIDGGSLKRYVVVGHSMTGKVALAFAARHPHGLQGLILVTPSPPSPEPIEDQARKEMLARDGSHAGAEAMITKILGKPLPPALMERSVEDHMRSSPAAWSAWLESGSYEDWSSTVGVLTLPTLIVTGQADPALPKAIQNRLTLPHVPSAKLVDFPECGHLPPLEAAAKLTALIRDFMLAL